MKLTLILALAILVLDRGAKIWVRNNLEPLESRPLWPEVFHMTYVQNQGGAFGLLEGQLYLFLLVPLIVVSGVLLAVHYYPGPRGWLEPAAALLVGGAIGNAVDRVQWGYVVDFLDFRFWPVFNVADMAIVGGAILFFLFWWRHGGGWH